VKKQDPYEVADPAMLGDRAWLRKLLGELSELIRPAFSQVRSGLVAVPYIVALLAVTGDGKPCRQLGEQAAGRAGRAWHAAAAAGAAGRVHLGLPVVLARLQRFIITPSW
jgi:hypothetical protein